MKLHGWDDEAAHLHRLSVEGRWDDMVDVITDEMMEEFCVVGTWDELPGQMREKYAGINTQIGFGARPTQPGRGGPDHRDHRGTAHDPLRRRGLATRVAGAAMPRRQRIEVVRTIDRPLDVVFNALSDERESPHWRSATAADYDVGGPCVIGAKFWRAAGSRREGFEVTSCEPYGVYATAAIEGATVERSAAGASTR